MSRRTQIFTLAPWTGGLNSSVDEGVLPSNDLVQADNVVFSASGTRLKREGVDYFNTQLPAVTHRSSSGTTRTIVFASSVSTSVPVDHQLVVGERIKVSNSGNTNYDTTGAVLLSVSGDTITYAGDDPLTESSTAVTGATVARAWSVIGTIDFWYFNSDNNAKVQTQVAVSNQGKLFRYDDGGRRTEILPKAAQTPLPATVSRSSSGTTRTIVFASSVASLFAVNDFMDVRVAGNSLYVSPDAVVTAVSGTSLSYTFQGATALTEGSTADTSIVIKRENEYTVTALVSSPSICDLRAYNNKLLITFDGVGNTPKVFDPMDQTDGDVWHDLFEAPDANIMMEYLGRLWMDDKLNRDRLQYSAVFNERVWGGRGDSGALDIGLGDGDTQGISAIMPPYRGHFLVAKGDAVYDISGTDPATFDPEPLTHGFGSVSHRATVPVDLDDLYFMSRRGFHTVGATNTTGDFAANFLSHKIQLTFNNWNKARLRFTQGAYISTLNSVAWTVAENGASSSTSVWLYNPTIQHANGEVGAWFRWPNLAAQSVCVRLTDSKPRVMFGDDEGNLLIGQNGGHTDKNADGIPFRIKTGTIYPDGNPQTIKAFKKLSLLFRPRGRFSFTAYFKVDGDPVQAVDFSQTVTGDKLGIDFVLGQSRLGSASRVAPVTKDIYGHGRGFSLEIFQNSAEAQVEIYGALVEYESADIADEVDTQVSGE